MKIAHHNKIKKGFTLIELLIVISIISLLVTLGFTGFSIVQKNARVVEATTMATGVKTAISAFQREYRRMPVPGSISSSGDHEDFSTDEEFMDIMLGLDDDLNPKGEEYLEVKPAKIASGSPRSGLGDATAEGGGTLYDPWGRVYGIRVNVVNRSRVPNPFDDPPSGDPSWGSGQSTKVTDNPIINESIVVWSAGEKEDDATDNPITF